MALCPLGGINHALDYRHDDVRIVGRREAYHHVLGLLGRI
jgi:hypothetical protein